METKPPIAVLESAFSAALRAGPVVVTAPTGSGKSTVLPRWAAALESRVYVVEPRRVACRSLARFVAQSSNTTVGHAVGYAIRHDERLSDATRIAFITPGVALRMLAGRIGTDDVVLLDEFHQRSLELDLLLAVLLRRGHRRLAVVSATLQGDRIASHISGAHLRATVRQYPVAIHHVGDDPVPHGRRLSERVLHALEDARLVNAQGDVLVFLPGKAEIAACLQQLARQRVFQPLPLHADLSAQEQDRAFEPSLQRRAILSTNVAETSVTLPGVRSVIDSGLVRRTVFREGRGALMLTPVANDAAQQRAGRAGRLAPGVCLRLWHASGKLEPRTPPAILREDLSQLMLWALQLDCDPYRLPWLDAPRDYALDSAEQLLRQIALLVADKQPLQLTALGRQVGQLPLDPVLGRLLLSGRQHGVADDMLLLVAALSVDRQLFVRGEPAAPASGEPDALTDSCCDVSAVVLALRDPRRYRSRLRQPIVTQVLRSARQLAQLLQIGLRPGVADLNRTAFARAILSALPHSAFARRHARARQDAWGNGKVEVQLARESLISKDARTILVVDQHISATAARGVRRLATCCMPVSEALLRELGAGSLETVSTAVKEGRLWAQRQWRLGTTVLQRFEEQPTGRAAREAIRRALLAGQYLQEAMRYTRAQIDAHNLRAALGSMALIDLETWLDERLVALGVESAADMELIHPTDLDPGLLDDSEMTALRAQYPDELTALNVSVSYDPQRKVITLHGRGKRPIPPSASLLPRWSGWQVIYTDGKKQLRLR